MILKTMLGGSAGAIRATDVIATECPTVERRLPIVWSLVGSPVLRKLILDWAVVSGKEKMTAKRWKRGVAARSDGRRSQIVVAVYLFV